MFTFLTQICDFGLAKWKAYSKTNTKSRSNRAGTVAHIPPESWMNINCPRSVKYDVYSFGVLLWELFTEDKPYKNGIDPNSCLDNRLVISMKVLFRCKLTNISMCVIISMFPYFSPHIIIRYLQ